MESIIEQRAEATWPSLLSFFPPYKMDTQYLFVMQGQIKI